MTPSDVQLLNPLTLAFVGDGVFELLARRYIVTRYGSLSPKRLHMLAVSLVCAKAQAEALLVIEPLLTEEELTICRRGRNSSGVTVPKSATAADYRRATALEALFGWLELKGETPRMQTLFALIADNIFSSNPPVFCSTPTSLALAAAQSPSCQSETN
jgi:ribonuclease-3 family protein